jgi:rhamnosyltransferase
MPPSPERRVSVVIPVLDAASWLPALFDALQAQTPVPPDEIILVDSGSTDDTRRLAQARSGVRVISLADFSHGRSRNLGAREASGAFVVFLSQDATPADARWLAELLAPFEDPRVAAVCSRQVPRPDAPPTERFFLGYHFPAGTPVRREKGGKSRLGLADVFFSNVSAAVRRDLLLRFPFDEELIMSEDQQLSRDLLDAGFAVVYQPTSVVLHSHRYTLFLAFRRYFDSVYSLTRIFPDHDLKASAAMGRRYLRRELAYMIRHHPFYLPYYVCYLGAKTLGALAAHHADRLPLAWRRRCSLHRYYWKA